MLRTKRRPPAQGGGHLTAPNPDLDRLIRQTPAGMMHWAGTASDPSATCGECEHYGYETAVHNKAGDWVSARKYPAGCALYQKHTSQHVGPIPLKTPACKYFEPKTPGGS